MGKVEDDEVYTGTGWNAECIGKVDKEGDVYRGTGWNAECVGRVERDGDVYKGTGWNAECVGRVEGPDKRAAGAALLLLIKW